MRREKHPMNNIIVTVIIVKVCRCACARNDIQRTRDTEPDYGKQELNGLDLLQVQHPGIVLHQQNLFMDDDTLRVRCSISAILLFILFYYIIF